MESGVSENAMSGHIQFIKPGETACFQCAPPLIISRGEDEKILKKDGVCAASLPTTMSIIAGFLVQNVLKYLLEFGEVSNFLGYNAMQNFFPSYTLKPNLSCSNKDCAKASQVYQENLKNILSVSTKKQRDNIPITHSDNHWGITIEGSSENFDHSQTKENTLPEGLKYQFDQPSNQIDWGDFTVDTKGENLETLQAKFMNLF